jgi:dipeptidyl aminopeptidase/acylaminoacyl peptidase
VPERLRRLSNEVIVGVASGKLWRFNVSNGDLTSTSEIGWRGMTSISVESDDVAHGDEMPDVIVRGRDNRDTRDYRLDASTGRLSEVDCAVGSRLLAHSAVGQIVACYADGRNGAYLSVVKEGRESFNVSLNDGLIDVAESEVRTFDYRSQNGEQLEAAVMLPIGYEPGHRYPLVTWVYPGQSAADAVMQHKLNVPLFLNLQLLCARGYAVLIPSMPYDGGEEIYGRLTSGVLGALDAVIEMGIADSEKVAVMGHSGGGFAVYGLISQTTRFKVAIASAGPSNLISMYGSFGGGERYLRTGVMPWSVAAIEGGIFRLPPPWKKRWTYLLNSPTSFVDRIATPLLIIHGDLDFVPVTQADEMFVALERQGKRVRYARYLGEGHDLESPANIRDVWGQIYRWLSEYLG